MIVDDRLRWIVTVLLGAAIVVWGNAAVRSRSGWLSVVGYLLHIGMAVAMLDMAWPSAMYVSNRIGELIFAAIGIWYALCTATRRYRLVAGGYHVVMMVGMAWMYAVMSGDIATGTGHHVGMPGAQQMSTPGDDVAGDDMSGMNMSEMGTSMGAGLPGWAHVGNVVWVAVFAGASVWWMYRYFAARQGRTDGCGAVGHTSSLRDAGPLGQVCMAASMATMFAVMV